MRVVLHAGTSAIVFIVVAGFAFAVPAASAQTSMAEERATVGFGLKTGVNVERGNSRLAGESAGYGLSVSYLTADGWGVEGEVWLPRFMDVGRSTLHRHLQLNVGALRVFGQSRVRPFIMFGGGVGLVQNRITLSRGPQLTDTDFTGFVHAGFGTEILFHRHFAVVPELRVNVLPGLAIVRPCLGVRARF